MLCVLAHRKYLTIRFLYVSPARQLRMRKHSESALKRRVTQDECESIRSLVQDERLIIHVENGNIKFGLLCSKMNDVL